MWYSMKEIHCQILSCYIPETCSLDIRQKFLDDGPPTQFPNVLYHQEEGTEQAKCVLNFFCPFVFYSNHPEARLHPSYSGPFLIEFRTLPHVKRTATSLSHNTRKHPN